MYLGLSICLSGCVTQKLYYVSLLKQYFDQGLPASISVIESAIGGSVRKCLITIKDKCLIKIKEKCLIKIKEKCAIKRKMFDENKRNMFDKKNRKMCDKNKRQI